LLGENRGAGQGTAPPAVRIQPDNEWAWCGERRLRLTPRSFAVLRHLVTHAQRLVTKDEFFTVVWHDTVVSEAALASCIRDLRKELGDSSRKPRYIETAHRRGFRFIGPVAGEPAPSPSPRGRGTAATSSVAPAAPSPVLVGRAAELARLHAHLATAMDGRRQLVFVTGEPGIGKTSLVETFLAQIAGTDGLRIGRGQCVEQYGAGEAYLPILEALGRLGRQARGDALVQILKQHAPTWLAQLPALLSDEEIDGVQRRAEGATRDRMLRELVEALDVISGDAPLVLLLEDLHWSDSATIDLLAMLARRRDAARLLVVATYRPADVIASGHPVRAAKRELQLHGRCEELPLDFLDVAAVGEYLERRFPGSPFPSELAQVLHRHTDGNPLFLLNTVDDLIARNQMREVDGRWILTVRANDIALGAPETLWQMVEKQAARLTPEDRALLAMGSVAGVEFSAAVAAGSEPHDGERRCDALVRRGQFLRAAGEAAWPDGTVAGRYAFIHALYQSVLYAGVPVSQRMGLHLRIGERLERGYGDSAGEIAGELAMHFERARDFERALQYRRQAGENALRQHGYREAATHATQAIELLRTLPDAEERPHQELLFQVMLGGALTASRGFTGSEVGAVYARVRTLCASVGGSPEISPILLVLVRFYLSRGEMDIARGLTREMLQMAEAADDPGLLLWAHTAAGIIAFYTGDFAVALEHFERGAALYDPHEHTHERSRALLAWQNPGVSCVAHSALTLWILGYPSRAAARGEEALTLARSLQHPHSLAYACHYVAALHQARRDHQTMSVLVEAAFDQAKEHGLGVFIASGAIQRGWLLAERGHAADGLASMQQGVAALREIGANFVIPTFLASMAEVYEKARRPAEGLATVRDALALAEASGQHYWTAELHRLKGALALQSDDLTGAEACFRDAIDIARRQGARSFELRAVMSLSRLWARHGKTSDAHALLSDACSWFTEGLDTPDLIDARTLLTDLARGLTAR
jgi:predicted ATPase/DNA-binding winged helix-turn-helix (wHTH) protein